MAQVAGTGDLSRAFARKGVPAITVGAGLDKRDGGVAAGRALRDGYLARCYHQPSDEVHEGWKLDGVVQDLQALYGVGRELAAGSTWPNWYEGNPFKAARDKMMQGKEEKAAQ